jgi:hypothetical protein
MSETLEELIQRLTDEQFADAEAWAYEGGTASVVDAQRKQQRAMCERDVREMVDQIIEAYQMKLAHHEELKYLQAGSQGYYDIAREAYDAFYYVPPSPPWDMRMRSIKSYELELNEDFRLRAVRAQKRAASESATVREMMGIKETDYDSD